MCNLDDSVPIPLQSYPESETSGSLGDTAAAFVNRSIQSAYKGFRFKRGGLYPVPTDLFVYIHSFKQSSVVHVHVYARM